MTWARFDDDDQRDMLIKGFIYKVLEYACSALNARTNFTLYFGVDDNGRVTGIKFESYELVRLLRNEDPMGLSEIFDIHQYY